ncbi:hypothetical protein TrLO_g1756 [Triparma laevis f. longispina]|uniref:Uncharacterized protein n=1 Tax=Triparma laevis f. longispina TaxID=1714387 RepID=A0A9W7C0G1_9STRA|nr:hypothetical protein TrLO_g1756 [Triparma laevis f. longispina]
MANRDNNKIKWFTEWEKTLPDDLSTKTMAITGSTSGTGLIFARTVATRGAKIFMFNRDSSRATAALDLVKASSKSPDNVVHITYNLEDFSIVKDAALNLIKACPKGFDVLINNAVSCATKPSKRRTGTATRFRPTTCLISSSLLRFGACSRRRPTKPVARGS